MSIKLMDNILAENDQYFFFSFLTGWTKKKKKKNQHYANKNLIKLIWYTTKLSSYY